MTRQPRLDFALKRLYGALDALEAAAVRITDNSAAQRALAESLAAAEGERDAALTRSQALEQAAGEVAERLGHAGSSLRRLLASEAEA